MSYTENNNAQPTIAPWLSWHEYELDGELLVLLFEQRTKYYYILKREAAKEWHELIIGKGKQERYLSLELLYIDGILLNGPKALSYSNQVGKNGCIKKSRSIPKHIYASIKQNGYYFDVHWDITNKCNEKCIHCYGHNAHNGLRNFTTDELTFGEAKKLVDDLYWLGVFRLVLSGGEVLTKDYIIPLCRYIRHRGIQLIIYTNGFAFTENLLQKFVEVYPSTVCISVYGDSEQAHDSITQVSGSFNGTINALSYFTRHGIETCHKNTLLASNYHCWRSTLKQGTLLSNHSLVNCTIYPSMDGGALNGLTLTESQLIELALSPDSPIYCNRKIVGACNIKKKKSETPCYNETNTLYINPQGEACICIAFPCVIASLRRGDIRGLKRYVKPSRFQTDFSGLCGTKKLDNWRALKISDLKECGTYDYCAYCVDVCPGDAFLIKGDLLSAPENHCAIAKARYKASQIIADH